MSSSVDNNLFQVASAESTAPSTERAPADSTSAAPTPAQSVIGLYSIVKQENQQINPNVMPVFTAPNRPKIATNIPPRLDDSDALPISPLDPIDGAMELSIVPSIQTSEGALATLSNSANLTINPEDLQKATALLTHLFTNTAQEGLDETAQVTTEGVSSTTDLNATTTAALIFLTALLIGMEIIVNGMMAQNNVNQTQMQKNELEASKATAANIKAQIDEMEAQKNKQDILGWCMIALQIVVAVAMAPVDPVGSAIMMSMVAVQIAQKEGAIPQNWTGSELGDGFLKLGISLIAGLGAGAISAKVASMTARTAAEAGAEAGVAVGARAAERAAAQQAASASKFSGNGALFAGSLTLGTLNPSANFMNAAGASDKDKMIGEIISQIALLVLTLGAALKSGGTTGGGILGKMKDVELGSKINKLLTAIQSISSAGEGGFQIAQGQISMEKAEILDKMAKTARDSAILQAISRYTQSNSENFNQWLKGFNSSQNQLNSMFGQLMQAQAEAAQVLG